MLTPTIFLTMFNYNHDTNNRLLALASKLTPTQWATSHDYGHNTIHEIMHHTITVEEEWLHLCREGEVFWNARPIADYPDVPSLLTLSDAIHADYLPYVQSLTDDILAGTATGLMPDGIIRPEVVWHMLLHYHTHSTLHRSEVARMLTGFGFSPNSIDFFGYPVSR